MISKLNSLGVALTAAIVLTACGGGGGGGGGTTTAVDISPAKGAIFAADVTVQSTTGTSLGTSTTAASGAADAGKASVNARLGSNNFVVFAVEGNSTATYFDEGTGQAEDFTANDILVSLVPAPAAGETVGVTPFTSVAAKLAGVDPATGIAYSGVTITEDSILEGVARVLLALGLPATFDLFADPDPVLNANDTSSTDYGKLLADIGANAGGNALTYFQNMISAAPARNSNTASLEVSDAVFSFTGLNTIMKAAVARAGLSISINDAILAPTADQLTSYKDAIQAAQDGKCSVAVANPLAAYNIRLGTTADVNPATNKLVLSAGSGVTVTLASGTTSVATVSGTTITPVAVGETEITVTASGSSCTSNTVKLDLYVIGTTGAATGVTGSGSGTGVVLSGTGTGSSE